MTRPTTSGRNRAGIPPLPEPLPGATVDSHCHLDLCAADDGPTVEQALSAARSVGITKIIQVGCDVPSSRWSAAVAAEHADVWAAVALHPNEAPRIHVEGGLILLEAAWREISELAQLPSVRAIGETGMDFYRTEGAGLAVQEESFRKHIEIAKATGKTLVVHDREAHDDVLRVLDDEGAPDVVVLHCFSGDARFAAQAAERGYYTSFAGQVTFKNAADLREALLVVPLDRLLVETDAPFLTPTPYRGQLNASYLVPLTVRLMAEVRDVGEAELVEQLYGNSQRAFGAL